MVAYGGIIRHFYFYPETDLYILEWQSYDLYITYYVVQFRLTPDAIGLMLLVCSIKMTGYNVHCYISKNQGTHQKFAK